MPTAAKKKKKRSIRPENYHLEIGNETLRRMFLRTEEFDRMVVELGEEEALKRLPDLDKKYGLE